MTNPTLLTDKELKDAQALAKPLKEAVNAYVKKWMPNRKLSVTEDLTTEFLTVSVNHGYSVMWYADKCMAITIVYDNGSKWSDERQQEAAHLDDLYNKLRKFAVNLEKKVAKRIKD